jgi:hypothetical protein
MQRLTLSELMSITGIGTEQLKSMRRRGQFAAAFSCKDAFATLRYTGADAVAVLLAGELAKTFGAKEAAQLTVLFGGALLRAIAAAEHSSAGSAGSTGDALLGLADLVRDGDGRRAYLACSAPDVGAEGYTVERVVTVNVAHLVRRVRAEADRVGINLSGAFMPAPDSGEFREIMAPYGELPAIVEHSAGARRKRLTAAGRAGERARQIAMGGVAAGVRKGRPLPAAA